MPNQRKKNKQKVGVWIEDTKYAELRLMADRLGITVSDLIKQALAEYKNGGNENEASDR